MNLCFMFLRKLLRSRISGVFPQIAPVDLCHIFVLLHWNLLILGFVRHTLPLFDNLLVYPPLRLLSFFLCSLSLIIALGSCLTVPLFKLISHIPCFCVGEMFPVHPPLYPIKGSSASEASCKVQKTAVKDNNWVLHKKGGRETKAAQQGVSQSIGF